MGTYQESLLPHSVVARNYASASSNRVHDDTVARRLGYEGALVPGVALFAYLTVPVLRAHGREWLEGGLISARFRKPIYDGKPVEARGEFNEDAGLYDLKLLNQENDLCADGQARILDDDERVPHPPVNPHAMAPQSVMLQPDVSVLQPGRQLSRYSEAAPAGSLRGEFGESFLEQIGDPLDIYTGPDGVWHPGYPVYLANALLMASIDLGLWIHTGSTVRYLASPPRSATLAATGTVLASRIGRKGVNTAYRIRIEDEQGRVYAEVDHEAIINLDASQSG